MKSKSSDTEDTFILEEPADTKVVADTYNKMVFLQINRISSKMNDIGERLPVDRHALLSVYCSLRGLEATIAPFRKNKVIYVPSNIEIGNFGIWTIEQRLAVFELLSKWFDNQVRVFSRAKGVLPPIAVRMYAGSGKIVEPTGDDEIGGVDVK